MPRRARPLATQRLSSGRHRDRADAGRKAFRWRRWTGQWRSPRRTAAPAAALAEPETPLW